MIDAVIVFLGVLAIFACATYYMIDNDNRNNENRNNKKK